MAKVTNAKTTKNTTDAKAAKPKRSPVEKTQKGLLRVRGTLAKFSGRFNDIDGAMAQSIAAALAGSVARIDEALTQTKALPADFRFGKAKAAKADLVAGAAVALREKRAAQWKDLLGGVTSGTIVAVAPSGKVASVTFGNITIGVPVAHLMAAKSNG